MKEFNYKQYLTEGWMFQEAGAKDDYFTRQRRAQQGNWKGSVGEYIQNHRAEIDAAARRGHGELRAYIRSTMMPALGPEEQEYLEQLLTGYADDRRLHQALYNILLKGQGLGLHETKYDSLEELVYDNVHNGEYDDEFRSFMEEDDPEAIPYVEELAQEQGISFVEAAIKSNHYTIEQVSKELDLWSEPEPPAEEL